MARQDPPRPKHGNNSRLEAVRSRIHALENEISDLHRECQTCLDPCLRICRRSLDLGKMDAAKRVIAPKNKRKKLIPKPQGMAGRTKGGYQLISALGLQDNRARFNKLAVRANESGRR